jgi:hypothetical protein
VRILELSKLLSSGSHPSAVLLNTRLLDTRAIISLGIPQDLENDTEFHKNWADKIINFMNNEIKWKYSNIFKFRGNLAKSLNGKVTSSLDEVLLDEDIGGFVGMFLFDSVEEIKDDKDIMKDILRNPRKFMLLSDFDFI